MRVCNVIDADHAKPWAQFGEQPTGFQFQQIKGRIGDGLCIAHEPTGIAAQHGDNVHGQATDIDLIASGTKYRASQWGNSGCRSTNTLDCGATVSAV